VLQFQMTTNGDIIIIDCRSGWDEPLASDITQQSLVAASSFMARSHTATVCLSTQQTQPMRRLKLKDRSGR